MLTEEQQGLSYRVVSFTIHPEVQVYDANGDEDVRGLAPIKLIVQKSLYGKTLPELMTHFKLLMESGKP